MHRRLGSTIVLSLAALSVACEPSTPAPEPALDAGRDAAEASGALEIVPGAGIGPVRIGMRYAEVRSALGPLEGAFASDRLAFGRYSTLGLEVVLVSAEDGNVSDDALVVGVGALTQEGFTGPLVPGTSRSELERVFGAPDDEAGETDFYQEGFSVEYDADVVLKVGVFGSYTNDPLAPEMRPALTRMEAM